MSSGAGLGLALVREIARGHGGRAYVADAPRGARVVLEIAAGALREQRTA
jgi:signal transduction histidine kinase